MDLFSVYKKKLPDHSKVAGDAAGHRHRGPAEGDQPPHVQLLLQVYSQFKHAGMGILSFFAQKAFYFPAEFDLYMFVGLRCI